LAVAIDALERQTIGNFEVLVVENGPERGAREFCAARGIRYVHEPRIGLSRARNTAARAALGDIVAYIDDDAEPQEDWLEHLLAPFCDRSIRASTGTIRYMKAIGNDRVMSDEDIEPGMALRPAGTFGPETRRWFTIAALGGIGDGSNMAFRRAHVANEPLFDERVGRGNMLDGGEEHLAFVRLIASGHRMAHAPSAIVRHPIPADAALLQAKQFADLRTSIAYLLFLGVEFPRYRGELAGHLLRAVLRRLSGYRYSRKGRIGIFPALLAMICGPFLFWRSARAWQQTRTTDDRRPQAPVLEEARTLE